MGKLPILKDFDKFVKMTDDMNEYVNDMDLFRAEIDALRLMDKMDKTEKSALEIEARGISLDALIQLYKIDLTTTSPQQIRNLIKQATPFLSKELRQRSDSATFRQFDTIHDNLVGDSVSVFLKGIAKLYKHKYEDMWKNLEDYRVDMDEQIIRMTDKILTIPTPKVHNIRQDTRQFYNEQQIKGK
ncbi:MAG: hypothetical protein LBL75_04220 [Rickettsiales bacterium]|jgi:hypothetical protein|nr:hypothetical protein [Rickettsiales bacterium]